MKEFRLVLGDIIGEWIRADEVDIDSVIRSGKMLDNLGYKDWYLEWR